MMGEGCQIKIGLTIFHFIARLAIKEKLNRNEESRIYTFFCKYQAPGGSTPHGYFASSHGCPLYPHAARTDDEAIAGMDSSPHPRVGVCEPRRSERDPQNGKGDREVLPRQSRCTAVTGNYPSQDQKARSDLFG